MYNKNIISNPGRPASRPVCWPEPAGLYAGVGRSLCRRRPVSMPASAGLYAGQPLFDCVAVPFEGFFFGKNSVPKTNNAYLFKQCNIYVGFCYFGQC